MSWAPPKLTPPPEAPGAAASPLMPLEQAARETNRSEADMRMMQRA